MDKNNRDIVIIVNGKFHAFDYAAELHRQKRLKLLISTLPYFVAKKYGLTRDVYTGLVFFEVLQRAFYLIFKKHFPALFGAKFFTKIASLFIPKNTKVIIGFAGYSSEIFSNPKFKNTFKILDRGSTHTLSNIALNTWAARFHNSSWKPNSPEFVQRELDEYKLANLIVVPSNFVKSTFSEHGVEKDKVVVLPYGISAHKFTNNDKTKLYQREKAVLFVGQFSPRKGIGVLVDAVKIVRERYNDIELWLVGSDLGIIDSSIFNFPWIKKMGILKGEKLYSVYKSASVFCLPSFEEGLSLVLTEAIGCGLPVVTTPNSGGVEIIKEGKNGLIVPVANTAETAVAIINILENRSSFEFYENEFALTNSWQNFTDNLLVSINEKNKS